MCLIDSQRNTKSAVVSNFDYFLRSKQKLKVSYRRYACAAKEIIVELRYDQYNSLSFFIFYLIFDFLMVVGLLSFACVMLLTAHK